MVVDTTVLIGGVSVLPRPFDLTVRHSLFEKNSCPDDGGAISLTGSGSAVVENTTFMYVTWR